MSAGELPLVSVVTPVYNGAPYLEECIESVLRQTYTRWEHVIVNNCSTDRTLEIAQAFAARDPRIRVVTNTEFVGVIQNHNIACRQVSGESRYVKVLQGDDWLYPECLAEMVALAERHPSAAMVGSYAQHGDRIEGDGLPLAREVMPGREVGRLNLLRSVYTFLSPTVLLMRADVVRSRERFYNEAQLHADVEACYDVLRDADFGFVHKILSFVRKQEESLTVTKGKRFMLYPLSNIELLVRFGPTYLEAAEFAEYLRVKLNRYYEQLAYALLRSPDRKQIWQEHSARMAAIGRPVSVTGLAAAIVRITFARFARG